jgi:hypothetical protein
MTRRRTFPFDPQTDEVYATSEWQNRTGVGQLAQVLFRKPEDQFLMLAFCGDGTGEHGKGPFVVAGYLADTYDWWGLECDWERERQKRPSIRYFKARESVLHKQKDGRMDFGGEFRGWTTDAVKHKCTELAEIIGKHSRRLVAISSPMEWDVYHAVIGNDVFKQVFYTPYLICTHGVIDQTLKRSNQQFKEHPGRVAFVFDTESEQLDIDTAQHYRLAPENFPDALRSRCGSLSFDDDVKFPMLQPADFLAWSIRAERAGLPSPWIDILFKNCEGGSHEAKINPVRLREIVADTEDKFHKQFPDYKLQQSSAKARSTRR